MGGWMSRHKQHEGDNRQQQTLLQPTTEELIRFLSTASGATWLADVLLEFPGNVEKLHRASLTEVNQFVIAKYKEFTASDIGTRLIFGSGQRSAVQADTLMLPVYIVEDFVRQRLRAKITRNWWSIGWFLAIRTPITCAAVYFTKHFIKKHLLVPHRGGRCKRVVNVATFVLDELLPTQFYGPLLSYALLAHKMVQELDDS